MNVEEQTSAPVAGGGVACLKVLGEIIRHMDATMPTPIGRRGESNRHPVHHAGMAHDLRKATEAVAELIAADKEYDEAGQAAFDNERLNGERWRKAKRRRAAALSNISASHETAEGASCLESEEYKESYREYSWRSEDDSLARGEGYENIRGAST